TWLNRFVFKRLLGAKQSVENPSNVFADTPAAQIRFLDGISLPLDKYTVSPLKSLTKTFMMRLTPKSVNFLEVYACAFLDMVAKTEACPSIKWMSPRSWACNSG